MVRLNFPQVDLSHFSPQKSNSMLLLNFFSQLQACCSLLFLQQKHSLYLINTNPTPCTQKHPSIYLRADLKEKQKIFPWNVNGMKNHLLWISIIMETFLYLTCLRTASSSFPHHRRLKLSKNSLYVVNLIKLRRCSFFCVVLLWTL